MRPEHRWRLRTRSTSGGGEREHRGSWQQTSRSTANGGGRSLGRVSEGAEDGVSAGENPEISGDFGRFREILGDARRCRRC